MTAFDDLRDLPRRFQDKDRSALGVLRSRLLGGPCPLLQAARERRSTGRLFDVDEQDDWGHLVSEVEKSVYGDAAVGQSPLSARLALIDIGLGNASSPETLRTKIGQAISIYRQAWWFGADGPRVIPDLPDGNDRRPGWFHRLPSHSRDGQRSRLDTVFENLVSRSPNGWYDPALGLVGETLAWIAADDEPDYPTVSTPVLLAVLRNGVACDGMVARLTLWRIPHGCGVLYPHLLRNGYFTSDESFQRGLQNAWYLETWALRNTIDYDVCWDIELVDPQDRQRPIAGPITGRSAEAAIACALRALRHGDPLDDNTAVTACLKEELSTNWQLEKVDGVLDKLLADEFRTTAFAQNVRRERITDVLVATRQPEAGRELDNGSLKLHGVADVPTAHERMTRWGKMTAIANRAIAAEADAWLRANCQGDTADGYVPSPLSRRLWPEELNERDATVPRDRVSSYVPFEHSEALGDGTLPEKRIRIFADSGLGKTTLLVHLRKTIAQADNGKLPVHEPHRAKVWDSQTQGMVNQFSKYLPGYTDDDIRRWLQRLRQTGQLVYLLDALDQTKSTDELVRWLVDNEGAVHDCQVIVSGRRWTESSEVFDTEHDPSLRWLTLQVDPFGEDEIRAFLGEELVEQLQPWKELLGVPMLLMLLKDLATSGALDANVNRERLYHIALFDERRGLLSRGIATLEKSSHRPRAGHVLSQIKHQMSDVLSQVAWHMIEAENFTGLVEDDDFDALAKLVRGLAADWRVDDEIRTLKQINVLTGADLFEHDEDERCLQWRHLSFCEYFAGIHLAEKLTADGQAAFIARAADVLTRYDRRDDAGADDRSPRERWEWIFRFALSRAQQAANGKDLVNSAADDRSEVVNRLARLLIAHGSPYVVFHAIDEDGVVLDEDLDRLCRWLVHWTFQDHDYTDAWEDGDAPIPVELFDESVFATLFQRRFRNSDCLAAAWPILEGAAGVEYASIRQAAKRIQDEFLREAQGLRDCRTLIEFEDSFRPCPPRETDSLVFQMGASPGDGAYKDEMPRHAVRLRSRFAMADFPVTNAVYEVFDPSHFWHRDGYSREDDQPAIYVSWYMARLFGIWLSGGDASRQYRLPTEAEWEFACRAGSEERYWWGHKFDGRRCHNTKSGKEGRALGRAEITELHRNNFGLLYTLGNVWEWCEDWYDAAWYQHCVDAAKQAGTHEPYCDDGGPSEGSFRVLRGGSFRRFARGCRLSKRYCYLPRNLDGSIGFRLCLSSVFRSRSDL